MASLFVGGRLARKADRESGDHTRLINSRTYVALKGPAGRGEVRVQSGMPIGRG